MGNITNCFGNTTGLSPPRQRPGCTLGLNLDYAGVSLSLLLLWQSNLPWLPCSRIFIARTLRCDLCLPMQNAKAGSLSVFAAVLTVSGTTDKVFVIRVFNFQGTFEEKYPLTFYIG